MTSNALRNQLEKRADYEETLKDPTAVCAAHAAAYANRMITDAMLTLRILRNQEANAR
jgi:hypothetical protein